MTGIPNHLLMISNYFLITTFNLIQPFLYNHPPITLMMTHNM